MTAQTILTDPNDELRKPSELVSADEIGTDALNKLITDLIETMHLEKGVGIAAPQIGVHKRLIIIDTGDGPQAFINPEIRSKSFRKIESEEGCLSVPGVFGMVKRHQKVRVRATLPDGSRVSLKTEGFPSIIFQHEVDHLDGILFIDKVERYTNPPQQAL